MFKMKIVALCCLGVVFAGVGGVYGTWKYAIEPSQSEQQSLSTGLNEFYWTPEEVLPDLESIGKSHLDLINSIINDRSQGLNNKNSPLNGAIAKRIKLGKDDIGSMGNIQGGNLKHIFTTSETRALEFVIEFISDTDYNIYTFTDDDLDTADGVGVRIPVYRTKCLKVNGVWESQYSEYGDALTVMYDADNGKSSMSINEKTWIQRTNPLEI